MMIAIALLIHQTRVKNQLYAHLNDLENRLNAESEEGVFVFQSIYEHLDKLAYNGKLYGLDRDKLMRSTTQIGS